MVDSSILQNMVDYASLNQNDVVLDIGAGLGFLTRFLANKCKNVLAVESDARLVKGLREQVKDLPKVKIIEGDMFKVHIPQFNKVVSIPPYHISSPLLLWLFRQKIDCAVLILQKEFANRLIAPVKSEDYGWLAVVAYYYVKVELLDEVPKWMFYPQPKVDSIVTHLKPKKLHPFTLKSEVMFKQLTQSLFTHRNRKVRNAVVPFIKGVFATRAESAIKMVEDLSFRDKRVRELAPEDFGALSNALVE
jgi:16S rRNA (adenine1518-N6/adenine1519-N6)-dimethyltransferase